MIHFKFNLKYFLFTLFIFLAEVLIATRLKDIFFIRAYLGDVIVVVLIYTFIKSFFKTKNDQNIILGIFVFSCLVEFAQFCKLADRLGFPEGSLMYIVVGNSFSWIDILCYAVGCLLLFLFVKLNNQSGKEISTR